MAPDTLCVLIAYSLGDHRQELLANTVASLKITPSTSDNYIALDNASPHVATVPLLKQSFKNVVIAERNYGYWNALRWTLINHERLTGRSFRYTYVIESDAEHYDLGAMMSMERALDRDTAAGSVMCRKFSVSGRHFYDKQRPTNGSDPAMWITQTTNSGDRCTFEHVSGKVFKTDLPMFMHSLNRTDRLIETFQEVATKDRFTEPEFRKSYDAAFTHNLVYDGGIFTHQVPRTRNPETRDPRYINTAFDKILDLEQVHVCQS